MAKLPNNSIILLASALFLFSFLGLAHGYARFKVEGSVYCDTCRAQFVTRVSKYLAGSIVRLECRSRENGTLTYSNEGETNDYGVYRIQVDGDHEEDICEVVPVKSPDPECSEISKEPFTRKAAVISLTINNGIASGDRNANPLGFMRKEPLPECPEVLKELGITPSGLVP